MDNQIIFTSISEENFKQFLQSSIKEEMQKYCIPTPQPTTEFITRQETCIILGVSLPTLNEWTKQGLIVGYRISSRVRYKKSEILEALTKISTLKYRRGA